MRKILTTTQIKEILSSFAIGSFLRKKFLDRSFENQNYMIVTTKGSYLLKVFANDNFKDLQSQNDVIEYLHSHHVKVPKVIRNTQSKNITGYNAKLLSIYEFLEGKHIDRLSTSLVKNLATEIARLHQSLLKYGTDKKKYKGLKLRKIYIHGDLGTANILVKGDQVKGIVDFGNAHWGFLMNDLAIFAITFLDNKYLKYIPVFFAEYQKHIKLTKEERRNLKKFLVGHIRGVLRWTDNFATGKTGKQLQRVIKTRTDFTKKLSFAESTRIPWVLK